MRRFNAGDTAYMPYRNGLTMGVVGIVVSAADDHVFSCGTDRYPQETPELHVTYVDALLACIDHALVSTAYLLANIAMLSEQVRQHTVGERHP